MSSAATTFMPAWGKSAMLVGLLFGACWGGSIIYWRATDRMPTAGELAFCLVGVPLLLCGLAWLSRRMPHTESAESDKSIVATAGLSVNATSIAIFGSALRLPHGSAPAEVCAAIKSAKARPELDAGLRDADGFPVMTFRCADADDSVLQDEIVNWLTANRFGGAVFDEGQLRALTLASHVVIELADASPELKSQPMRLVPITPHDWTADQARAAGAWLQSVVVERSGWAAQRCTVHIPSSNEQAISCLIAAAREAAPQVLTMLLAFDSNISDAMVRRWDDDRNLFTAANPSGRIPGEGAAGMLVAASVDIPVIGGARACIASVKEGVLADAAVESKRPDPSILVDLMERALSASAVDAKAIETIAADTSHHTTGTLELLGAKNVVMPHLDDTEDVLRLGSSTGHCGVQSLAALIVAGCEASERQMPIMWVSNEDARQRSVAILSAMGQPRAV
jgi:hypothetical protein